LIENCDTTEAALEVLEHLLKHRTKYLHVSTIGVSNSVFPLLRDKIFTFLILISSLFAKVFFV